MKYVFKLFVVAFWEVIESYKNTLTSRWFWLIVMPIIVVLAILLTYLEVNGYIDGPLNPKAEQTQSQER